MGFINFLYFRGIGVAFAIIQFLILLKIKRSWIKWLPTGVNIIALLFCLVLYLNLFWTNSSSVLAENQYFSLFLLTPISISFIGCLLGFIVYKFCK